MYDICARAIALVLAIATASCWAQLDGYGSTRGLQPVAVRLQRLWLHRSCSWRNAIGSQPTLLWFACSDGALHAYAFVGVSSALYAFYGGAGSRCALLLANCVYLSFDVIFNLNMPWDCLLLEAGWLAVLLPAPAPLYDAGGASAEAVHPAAAFLLRWLLFRLMFGFGRVKFTGTASTDRLYVRDFMILQPMPSKLGWLAHYLPLPVHRLLLNGMYLTEMIAPFLLFVPRLELPYGCEPSQLAAALFIGLQLGILAHGSFGHFNLLTAALALPLLAPGGTPSLFAAFSSPPDTPLAVLSTAALFFYIPLGLLHLPFGSGVSRSIGAYPAISRWADEVDNGTGIGGDNADGGWWKKGLMKLLRALEPWRLIHA